MEHKFAIPNKPLNSNDFLAENGFDLFIRGEDLFISGDCTKAQAEAALAAHNPQPKPEPTVADKLASVGLTIEDLKVALGV
jgi:hypothetical protein